MTTDQQRRRTVSSTALLGLALLVAAVTAGCGGGDGGGGSDGDGSAATSEVVMELVAFKPGRLDVEAGATVTWRNRDVGAHTVTSGTVNQGGAGVTPEPDGAFDSGNLAKGERFERTFDEPGIYPYFCALHPATMRGEIRVT